MSATCSPVMLLLGIGAGLCFPALVTMAMSSATASDSGLASGLVNTTQQVGGALGLAVLASLSTTRTNHLLAGGDAAPLALTSGYHLAFVIGAGLVAIAIGLALTVLRPAVAAEQPAVRSRRGADWTRGQPSRTGVRRGEHRGGLEPRRDQPHESGAGAGVGGTGGRSPTPPGPGSVRTD